jgi:rare lipoprotein A
MTCQSYAKLSVCLLIAFGLIASSTPSPQAEPATVQAAPVEAVAAPVEPVAPVEHQAATPKISVPVGRHLNVQTGIASWYGIHWQGRKTASGDRFDVRKLTAAHRSLPLNTVVRVTNLLNGHSVEVLINDRGPYVGKRVIDLSEAAAREISMTKKGLVPVRIEIIEPA